MTVEELRQLCYECRFQQVVELADSIDGDEKLQIRGQLLKSQALFEMHKVQAARLVLKELIEKHPHCGDASLYVQAKLKYTDQEYAESGELFKQLSDHSETIRDYFKATLGQANVLFSMKKHRELETIVTELEEMANLVFSAEKLSFYLLKGAYLAHSKGQDNDAKEIFYHVIKEAQAQGWTYFIIKSLYSLAKLDKMRGHQESLEAHLKMIHCYLPEEASYLKFLVNEQFKEESLIVNRSIAFNAEHMKVRVDGQWIALHEKPLLYQFLELLHEKRRFVSKDELANRLWSNQEYKPRVHDPRIFDIARRIRSLIEPYDNQPVCLLSGRLGYKLAEVTPEEEHSREEVIHGITKSPKLKLVTLADHQL